MFGDPRQHDHMMSGVKAAHASPKTPEHLRAHLAKRLEGGSMAFPSNRGGNRVFTSTGRTAIEPRDGVDSDEITGQKPIKTVVGATGRSPIKTIAGTPRMDTRPLKTIVGSTARPPIKTKVGSMGGPPRKSIVGSTAAPPRKTTPGNLGTGGIGPLGMDAADRGPINAGNPSTISRALGNGDGNLGRSVSSTPPPAQGPPNPSMDWAHPWGFSGIQDGGMGPTAKRMGAPPNFRRGPSPRRPEEGGMAETRISGGRGGGRRGPMLRHSPFYGE